MHKTNVYFVQLSNAHFVPLYNVCFVKFIYVVKNSFDQSLSLQIFWGLWKEDTTIRNGVAKGNIIIYYKGNNYVL